MFCCAVSGLSGMDYGSKGHWALGCDSQAWVFTDYGLEFVTLDRALRKRLPLRIALVAK